MLNIYLICAGSLGIIRVNDEHYEQNAFQCSSWTGNSVLSSWKGHAMELLKRRILEEAIIIDDRIIKVDSFINHQMDIELFNEMGKEFKRRFAGKEISKILTVEASGIGLAVITAQYFNVPVVFAKKHDASNLDRDTYQSEVYSYTKDKTYQIRVAKRYLNPGDRVLIIDDFLANGNAASGLVRIVREAGAEVAGVGIAIEKLFQNGREKLLKEGIQLESLAIIESLKNGKIIFQDTSTR